MSPFHSELLTAYMVAGACIAAVAVSITAQTASPFDAARILDPSRHTAYPLERRGDVETLEPEAEDVATVP